MRFLGFCRAIYALAALVSASAWAMESWQPVFEDASGVASVDVASFNRSKQRITFRERDVYRTPQTNPDSLRNIVEVQSSKMVDCASRQLAVLSRAAFSENIALVRYEAVQAGKAAWRKPQSEAETALMVRMCGAA